MKKTIMIIFVSGILALIGMFGYLSAKITTFEQCEQAGWLVRRIRVDGNGSIEKECLLWTGNSFIKQKAPIDEKPSQTIKAQQNWETKSSLQPPVTIKVTPVELGKSIQLWRFQIVFDTHSGNLDEDPLKIITLSDDKGNIYQPILWEGPGPGGHHRAGVLIFNAINPLPPYVELKIKGVGGVSQRSFKWNIE